MQSTNPSTPELETWLASWLGPRGEVELNFIRRSLLRQGWGYHERRLSDHLIYAVFSSGMWVELEGQAPRLLGKGEVLWMPAGVCHSFTLAEPEERLELYYMRFRTGNSTPPLEMGCYGGAHVLEPLLRELFLESYIPASTGTLRLKLHLASILLRISEQKAEAHLKVLHGDSWRDFILGLERDDLLRATVPELASCAGMSLNAFRRKFKREFGLAPRTWLAKERVRRLAEELRMGSSTQTELAQQFAYPDVYTMGKQFKRFMGCSPGAWRAATST